VTSVGDGGNGWGASCDTGFQACGGDLTGTWNLQTACSVAVDLPYGEEGLFPGVCAEPGHYEGTTTVSGFITFQPDGTFNHDIMTTVYQAFVVPVSCLNEISELLGQPYTCETFIGGTIEGNKCVSILRNEEPYHDVMDGRYIVEGDSLAMTSVDPSLIDAGYYGGDSGVDPYTRSKFCVSGDTLRVRHDEGNVSSTLSALLTEFSATRGAAPMEPTTPTDTDGQ